jgi:N-acyl-D-amino-acid deacylase
MRAYGPKAEPAMAEMARIAREARARIHVSHYNVPAALGLRLIDDARAAGVDVTYDLYPYVAGSTTLLVWLPPDLYRGTLATMRETLRTAEGKRQLIDWFSSGKNEPSLEGVRFAHLSRPEHQRYLGTPIVDAAKSSGKPIGDFLYDLLMAEDLQVGIVAFSPGWRTESELERVMAHPTMMAGSDGIYVGARPHPRGWGTFVRYLAKYARDRRVFTIEDAVRRMTSFPARRFALTGRGLLAEGCFADLVLFDLEALAERATFECGRACAEGVSDVLVNGVAVVRDGRLTGATPGRPLRGPAWRRA